MTSEISPVEVAFHKERLLRYLSGTSSQEGWGLDELASEVELINKGLSSPDFLEILPLDKMVKVLRQMHDLPSQTYTHDCPEVGKPYDAYADYKIMRFRDLVDKLTLFAEGSQSSEYVTNCVMSMRKPMGFAKSRSDLDLLSQLFICLDDRGLLQEKSMALVHFGGAFNPFPHNGHVEVAKLSASAIRSSHQFGRVTVHATLANSDKPEIGETFTSRLDNLYRGFADTDAVTVLGLAGDLVNRHHRISQLEALASFDAEKKLRYVVGSDTLQKRLYEALDGDEHSRYVLREDHELYVSQRSEDETESLVRSIKDAQKYFGSNISLLPNPSWHISGTLVRHEPRQNRVFYASNLYVNI